MSVIILTAPATGRSRAGMDLAEFAAGGGGGIRSPSARGRRDRDPRAHQIISWEYPKPLVAALNGATVAGGFEILMCCDLAVAAEHVMFGLAEVKRGLMPGGGGTLLATRIPMAIALEITLTGDTIDCTRALELGLINRVVPQGTRSTRRSRWRGEDRRERPAGGADREEAGAPHHAARVATPVAAPKDIGAVFASEDAREGAMAFVEKRPPRH